ncbi:MAG TPA: hypothetical protein VLB69_03735, partial [Rudaea sp.]|nr:hypothetical protein [Rudaea sp.]
MLNSSPTAPSRETAAPLVIGVTSHRNIPVREEEAIRARVRSFFAMLHAAYPLSPLILLSPLAQGGDQWAADEALKAGIRLVAPLPMSRAQHEQDFSDGNARAAFKALCDHAEVVELSCVDKTATKAEHARDPGIERDRRYANAGMYLSTHCHILIAIWDGKDSGRLGGTAQIVNFHLRGIEPPAIGRRLNVARHNPLGSDNESLLFHIVCSREQPDGSPAAPLRPLQAYWRFKEMTVRRVDTVPDEFRAMFAHMGEFNADWARYRTRVDAREKAMRARSVASASARTSSDRSPSASEVVDVSHGRAGQEAQVSRRPGMAERDPIDALFGAADWLAIHFQRRVLFALRAIYTMAALMGIAFVYYANFPVQDHMIFVFLALFGSGVWISLLAGRRGWQRKSVDYRALAEGLRVQSYWRRAGLSATGDAEFVHDNFLQKQDVELGWIRNVMRSADLVGDLRARTAPADGLAQVIAEWVGESGKSG